MDRRKRAPRPTYWTKQAAVLPENVGTDGDTEEPEPIKAFR
ncbi:MAG: hypothetical protein RLY31_2929 [Bacteroidota bacterium]|jgi:hypothetical protein